MGILLPVVRAINWIAMCIKILITGDRCPRGNGLECECSLSQVAVTGLLKRQVFERTESALRGDVLRLDGAKPIT